MQNLGKADKTTDEIFEDHLLNFNTQQVNATRLHKDINNYLRCIRAMQTANKNLMDTLSEIYEKEWVGQDMLYVQAQNNEMLWADLAHKLADQVVTPLNTYQAQFPEMRKKIDKRGRKLIDFDAERHTVQQMQNNPNRNEAKFIRAKEQMENAKRTYEVLNSELHDELPALYDSRILFLVTNMQTLFAAEEVFHSETSKVYSELEAVVDKLAKEVQKGTLPRRAYNRPLPIANHSAPVIQNSSSMNSPPKVNTKILSPESIKKVQNFSTGIINHVKNYYNSSLWPSLTPQAEKKSLPAHSSSGDSTPIPATPILSPPVSELPPADPPSSEKSKPVSPIGIPSAPVLKDTSATTDNLPPGVLYKVKAAYKYQAEDVDELNFEVGEIIQVVEYEDPEEQEEGWLMGVKESTGQKGLFPANFSRPI
ncbi:myc box-dependent-interacting protein 1 isoform X2 [Eurytemora carolleeae]|uniref:myc box-dependent-interacting protein 1 isoform X2 n=1 Tax=Eurytemora carolleeae TaxID=1294199 RepID=UPI000C7642E2|nr:myc box-dependent-interacting protein 1 isoform X2 [Eurytemora carolleeae]|eukprot:XP_023345556.1 myc box-dependent-interacting protein 1-like isoform X2 [Eurytemora affinis]